MDPVSGKSIAEKGMVSRSDHQDTACYFFVLLFFAFKHVCFSKRITS